jgi:enterochelin esterase-like enzyme
VAFLTAASVALAPTPALAPAPTPAHMWPAPGFVSVARGPDGGTVWAGPIFPSLRDSVVYLPPAYSPSQRYPVVYLLHGMPGSPSGFVISLQLASQADGLIASGARPFIAIAPPAGPDRPYFGEWAGVWEDYLISAVLPWAARNLSTIAQQSGRAIAGLSAGGFGAVDIALRHPGVFGIVESWSGYFAPFRDGPLASATPAQLAAHNPTLLVRAEAAALRHVRFFLSSGESHGVVLRKDTTAFAAELARLGVPTSVLLLRSATPDYRTQFIAGLRFAFANVA